MSDFLLELVALIISVILALATIYSIRLYMEI